MRVSPADSAKRSVVESDLCANTAKISIFVASMKMASVTGRGSKSPQGALSGRRFNEMQRVQHDGFSCFRVRGVVARSWRSYVRSRSGQDPESLEQGNTTLLFCAMRCIADFINDYQGFYSSRADSSTAASSQQDNMVDGVGKQENMVDGDGEQDPGTERQAPGRKGSTESLDCVDEDLNRTAASRATGYMGKISEVNWLGQVRKRTDTSDDNQDESGDSKMDFSSGLSGLPPSAIKRPEGSHLVSESTYHCDDIALDVQDDVVTYQLPPKEVADLLLSCYLECVHPAFPILGKITFVKQYQAFYNNPMLQTGPLWLAILNLLFAIAARYGRLAQATWVVRADDENTYFSRARLLGLGIDALWVHGELQRIQVAGLASFYLMATNQINR